MQRFRGGVVQGAAQLVRTVRADTVSVPDRDGDVVSTANVGKAPWGVAVSPDGTIPTAEPDDIRQEMSQLGAKPRIGAVWRRGVAGVRLAA